MPEAAIAAPPPAAPAAPSSPASSAPSTPSSTPSPEVASPPSSGAPPVEAAGAAPASAAPGVKAEPNSSDFPETADGLMEFSKAYQQWEREQQGTAEAVPEVAADAAKLAEELATEEKPAAEQPAVVESDEEAPALTPEAISKLETETPELKTFFDAHPAVKGQFYKLARENARIAPIAEMFTNVDSAKFALDTSNRTVAIKTAFMQAAEDPTKIDAAFEAFSDEFAETDKDGNFVVDAEGNKTYAPDYYAHLDHVATGFLDGEIAVAKEALESGKITSERVKNHLQAVVDAATYLKEAKAKDFLDLDKPDDIEMSPEQKQWFDARDAELKRREEESGVRQKTQQTAARQQAIQAHNQASSKAIASEFGARLDAIIGEKVAAKVALPMFALKLVNPSTNVSYFAQSIWDSFIAGVKKDPRISMDIARLETLPPGEDSQRQRVEYFRQLREDENSPVNIGRLVNRETAKLQKEERAERSKSAAVEDKARAGVTPEPSGSSAPKPVGPLDTKAAYEKARELVEKETEGQYMTDSEKEYLVLKKTMAMQR